MRTEDFDPTVNDSGNSGNIAYSDTTNSSFGAASVYRSDTGNFQLHTLNLSGDITSPSLKDVLPTRGNPLEQQPLTAEQLKDRYAKFESLLKSSPPPEGTEQTVRDIGKALIKGDVKGIQEALGKVSDEKQLTAIADYLYGALGVSAKVLPGKGLQFDMEPTNQGGRGRGRGFIEAQKVDSVSISIFPDKVTAFARMGDVDRRRIDELSPAEAGKILQDAIFNRNYASIRSREENGNRRPESSEAQPSTGPSRGPENRPEPRPNPDSTRPENGSDRQAPQAPAADRQNPGRDNPAPAPKPDVAPQPKDKGLMQELRNVEEFKVRWKESLGTLENTPLGPLMKELGEQLASGKIDAEKLQKLLKNVKLSEQDLETLSKVLNNFNQNLQEMYGMSVALDFAGKGDEISIKGLSVKTGGPNSTRLMLNGNGDVAATQGGIAGANNIDTTAALKVFQAQIRGGRQDKGK